MERLFSIELTQPVGDEPSYHWVSPKQEVVIVKIDGKIRAFNSLCPHMGARLEMVDDNKGVFCPWHGLKYSSGDLTSNHHRYKKLCEIPVEVEGNKVFLGKIGRT